MDTQTIYIDVRHQNYWWGVYGITRLTDWEDVVISIKTEEGIIKKLNTICICSKRYLKHSIEELKDDPDEQSYVEEIQTFLNHNEITYRYYYDKPEDEDFYEVLFEAPRNEKGIKPRSIEIWHPSSGIDFGVIKETVSEFCSNFMKLRVEQIVFQETIPFDVALEEYKNSPFNNSEPVQIEFTNELVDQLSIEWNKSKDDVNKILKNLYNNR